VVKSAKKKGGQKNRGFFVVVALIAVVGIGALTYASTKKSVPVIAADTLPPPPIHSEGYVEGSPTAPVEVIEFGDFECPACGMFAELAEPDVRTNLINTGKIRLRFIDYPLPGHKNTKNASRAAACADEQGKFWPMHDLLYSHQDQWNGEVTDNPDAKIKQLGATIPGIDRKQLNDCIDSRRTEAKVLAHRALGDLRHVSGTPTFYVGNVGGVNPITSYDQFKQFLDSAVKMDASSSGPRADTTKKAAGATKK
jgi:protein-disulfide isomerase